MKLLLPLAATALAGCMATVPGAPPVVVECQMPTQSVRAGPALVGETYGMKMTPLPVNSVQFGSQATAQAMAVQSLFAERSQTDTVQVTARFVSCLDRPSSVRVRTSFLRASTAPAEAPTAWKTVYLEPRATAVYSELSTVQDVASYLIEVAQ
ncbi:MAG TPA: hypothetical protein VEA35_06425 [Ramlibacter sp.]|nr:hypothetical protein [Ramlibacter sp.]